MSKVLVKRALKSPRPSAKNEIKFWLEKIVLQMIKKATKYAFLVIAFPTLVITFVSNSTQPFFCESHQTEKDLFIGSTCQKLFLWHVFKKRGTFIFFVFVVAV